MHPGNLGRFRNLQLDEIRIVRGVPSVAYVEVCLIIDH